MTTHNNNGEIKSPSIKKYLREFVMIWWELKKLPSTKKKYQTFSKGDNHPVLVLPGFMGSDFSTKALRGLLNHLGYHAYAWDLGRNYGDIRQLNIIQEKIQSLYKEHQMKVSLIGWSLGGVYARQLAKENPELIRQVITMGSPFAGIEKPNNATLLYKLINSKRKIPETDAHWLKDIPAPAPVPTTAIFSREDGIVPWEVCLEEEDQIHQNIEVKSLHLGMGFDPYVWTIIENRLQYQLDNWIPFDTAMSRNFD